MVAESSQTKGDNLNRGMKAVEVLGTKRGNIQKKN
jgi:hypothetical protein